MLEIRHSSGRESDPLVVLGKLDAFCGYSDLQDLLVLWKPADGFMHDRGRPHQKVGAEEKLKAAQTG